MNLLPFTELQFLVIFLERGEDILSKQLLEKILAIIGALALIINISLFKDMK